MVREGSVFPSLIFLFWLSNLSKNSVTSLLVLGKPAVIFLPCGHTRFRTTFYAKGKCYCYYESYMNHSGIKLLCTDLKTMFQILLPRVNKMYNATSSYLMSSLKTMSLVFFPSACTRKSLSFPKSWVRIAYEENLPAPGDQQPQTQEAR